MSLPAGQLAVFQDASEEAFVAIQVVNMKLSGYEINRPKLPQREGADGSLPPESQFPKATLPTLWTSELYDSTVRPQTNQGLAFRNSIQSQMKLARECISYSDIFSRRPSPQKSRAEKDDALIAGLICDQFRDAGETMHKSNGVVMS